MQRYKLTIQYDGSHFSGWQKQPNARTVEEEIEKACSKILQQPVDIIGQGRTDAGVHATGQVAHVDVPLIENEEKFLFGINSLVGEEIFVSKIEVVDNEFHARFDAIHRQYEYRVLSKPLPLERHLGWFPGRGIDASKLEECASLLIGEHDFDSFSKFNEENYTTLCEVFISEWAITEHNYVFNIAANRFLRNMVRRLVGTMIEVAKGKMLVSDFEAILNNKETEFAAYTAPAKGLCLKEVFY